MAAPALAKLRLAFAAETASAKTPEGPTAPRAGDVAASGGVPAPLALPPASPAASGAETAPDIMKVGHS